MQDITQGIPTDRRGNSPEARFRDGELRRLCEAAQPTPNELQRMVADLLAAQKGSLTKVALMLGCSAGLVSKVLRGDAFQGEAFRSKARGTLMLKRIVWLVWTAQHAPDSLRSPQHILTWGRNPQTGEIHSEHQPRKPLDHGVRKKSLLNYLTTLAQQQQKGPEGRPAKRARAAHRPSLTWLGEEFELPRSTILRMVRETGAQIRIEQRKRNGSLQRLTKDGPFRTARWQQRHENNGIFDPHGKWQHADWTLPDEQLAALLGETVAAVRTVRGKIAALDFSGLAEAAMRDPAIAGAEEIRQLRDASLKAKLAGRTTREKMVVDKIDNFDKTAADADGNSKTFQNSGPPHEGLAEGGFQIEPERPAPAADARRRTAGPPRADGSPLGPGAT